MLRSFRLMLALSLFCPLAVSAQIDNPEAEFRSLRRGLEGTWFMPTDRGDRLEIWETTDDTTLTGKAIRIKPENGDTVLIERLRIELRDTTVTYFVTERGKTVSVAYKLTEIDDAGFFVFSNPKNDDPNKIKYLLLSNREVQVVMEGKRNGRTVTQEYVYEREFTPGAVEFRVKGGINAQTIRTTGNFPPSDLPDNAAPAFGWKPGWEIGTQIRFKGRGGFITINAEVGLAGKFAHAKSAFTVIEDTTLTAYQRDLTYNTVWLIVGLMPEISFGRDGRFSLMAGPYYGRLIGARGKGVSLPEENKLFKANNDFKKNDFGLMGGFQYKLNFGKKDLGGILGLRVNFGLANVDNLYHRYCSDPNSALCNESVSFQGATLYYSVDLLKL